MKNNIKFFSLIFDNNEDNRWNEELYPKTPKQIDKFLREKEHFSKVQVYITICTFTQTVCALIMTYLALAAT